MENFDLKIGCSELSNFMASSPYELTVKQELELKELLAKGSKSKKLQQLLEKKNYKPQFNLPDGAMSAVRQKVREYCFSYRVDIGGAAIHKGRLCEEGAIEMLSRYDMASYKKNEERINKGALTGECDIIYSKNIQEKKQNHIIDIKCPLTWHTMPQLESEVIKAGEKGGYWWQGRGYMYLFNAQSFTLAYCMMDTPFHLIPKFGNEINAYLVGATEDKYRISTSTIQRDLEIEKSIINRLEECQKYANFYYEKLINK